MHNDIGLKNSHNPEPSIDVAWVSRAAHKYIVELKLQHKRNISSSCYSSNRRISLDNREPAIGSPVSSEMLSGLSVVGSEVRKNVKPRVKTMSERDLTKRHVNCFTRSNGYF